MSSAAHPEALQLVSPRGILVDKIKPSEIRSLESARRLGPFVSPDSNEILIWKHRRNGSGRCWFARSPRRDIKPSTILSSQLSEHKKIRKKTIHNGARDRLSSELKRYIDEGKELNWYFKDRGAKSISEYTVKGNLLRCAEEIQTEYRYKSPAGFEIIFDIAVLGPKIGGYRMILGVVELELSHRYEFLKCMLVKSLGFPLLSLDLNSFTEGHEPTGVELRERLVETTLSSDNKRRRNHLDLHPGLYPVFLDWEETGISVRERYCYIFFASNGDLDKLELKVKGLRKHFNISSEDLKTDPLRGTNSNTNKQLKNVGELAGENWVEYNPSRALRVYLKPAITSDSLYLIHLLLNQLANHWIPTLIGFSCPAALRDSFWCSSSWNQDEGQEVIKRIIPTNLGVPINRILKELNSLSPINADLQ